MPRGKRPKSKLVTSTRAVWTEDVTCVWGDFRGNLTHIIIIFQAIDFSLCEQLSSFISEQIAISPLYVRSVGLIYVSLEKVVVIFSMHV